MSNETRDAPCASDAISTSEKPIRRRAVTLTKPSPRLFRILKLWRSESTQQGEMSKGFQTWRKMGVVTRAPVGENETANQQVVFPPTTTFLEACEQCNDEVIRAFLKKGAGKEILNAKDKTGKTGLSLACSNGFLSIVNLLRRPEIDANMADNEGNHPLIFAAQAGHADLVCVLLNYFPVNIDQPNHQGFTALMKAAIQGRARCAKLLLYAGATPYKRDDSRGLCAFEWAEYCGRQSTAKVIAQFMESCNLGLICANMIGDEKKSRLKSESGPSSRWRSDNCLHEHEQLEQTDTLGCMPFKILQKVRRSLPSSSTDSGISPLQSLEDIARLCYSPVFPEYISPPISRKGSASASSRRHVVIPKVEITLTSKDDNYFYETPLPFVRSPVVYKKYVENVEAGYAEKKVKSGNKGSVL